MTIVYSPDAALIERHLRQTLGSAAGSYARIAYRDQAELAQRLASRPLFAKTDGPQRAIVSGCAFLADPAVADRSAGLFSILLALQTAPIVLTAVADKLLTRHKEAGALLAAVKPTFLPKLTDYNFQELAGKALAEAKVKLSREAFANFCSRLVPDAGTIANEVAKLALFTEDERTPELLNDLVSDYGNASVFKLLELALARRADKVSALYDALVPLSFRPLDVLLVLCGQLLNACMAARADRGAPAAESVRALGISPFAFRAALRLTRDVRPTSLERALANALDLDLRIKKYNLDEFNGVRLFLCRGLLI